MRMGMRQWIEQGERIEAEHMRRQPPEDPAVSADRTHLKEQMRQMVLQMLKEEQDADDARLCQRIDEAIASASEEYFLSLGEKLKL